MSQQSPNLTGPSELLASHILVLGYHHRRRSPQRHKSQGSHGIKLPLKSSSLAVSPPPHTTNISQSTWLVVSSNISLGRDYDEVLSPPAGLVVDVVVEAGGGDGVEVLAKLLVILECSDSHYIDKKSMAKFFNMLFQIQAKVRMVND